MKHSININKTAFYHSLGDVTTAKTIWFVLHGYGYSAEYFIKNFNPITNEGIAVIAPEGLSKFYLKGVDGRVGASWMTKENREEEIKDYVDYLNKLYTFIIENNINSELKINVLGFSQGGATASRWISNGKIIPSNFILWASVFPTDMKFDTIQKNTKTFILYGDDDKYVSDDRIINQQEIINSSGLEYQLTKFKGKHNIPKEILIKETLANNW